MSKTLKEQIDAAVAQLEPSDRNEVRRYLEYLKLKGNDERTRLKNAQHFLIIRRALCRPFKGASGSEVVAAMHVIQDGMFSDGKPFNSTKYNRPYSPGTRECVLEQVKSAFRFFMTDSQGSDFEYLKTGIRTFRIKPALRPNERSEVAVLLDELQRTCEKESSVLSRIYFATFWGFVCRPGELVNHRVKDFSFRKDANGNEWAYTQVLAKKGGKGERIEDVGLTNAWALDLFKQHYEDRAKHGPDAPFFVNEHGRQLKQPAIAKRWKKASQAAGLPEEKQHINCLRHGGASHYSPLLTESDLKRTIRHSQNSRHTAAYLTQHRTNELMARRIQAEPRASVAEGKTLDAVIDFAVGVLKNERVREEAQRQGLFDRLLTVLELKLSPDTRISNKVQEPQDSGGSKVKNLTVRPGKTSKNKHNDQSANLLEREHGTGRPSSKP